MLRDPNHTIVALSSASGPGARSVIRLSGPDALKIVGRFFHSEFPLHARERRFWSGNLTLPELSAGLPAEVYVWPPPRTYTGQLMVEVQTLSSPPLVEALIAQCLAAGARAAGPGEFTMRGFLAGKLDLTRAEAVLAVIEAGNPDELRQALAQLAGGVAQPMQELRSDLLNLLADVEAGLDFGDEDIHFVGEDDLLQRLTRGMALLTNLRQQLDRRTLSDRPFRVVLAGKPNAGKSSLFNALGRATALVSSEPGTTRDYLVQRLDLNGVPVELLDTAGLDKSRNGINRKAQELGQEQLARADLVLLCIEAGTPVGDQASDLAKHTGAPILLVATKSDHHPALAGQLATSAVSRLGLDALRQAIRDRATDVSRPALAPSLSRCRHHVDTALDHLRRAHHLVLEQEPPELLALELRGALDHLGEMAGAVYTDDLLDRIFSRFCIGK